jgi:internalin A
LAEEPVRDWTNVRGKTIEARFTKFVGDKVEIVRADGQVFTVSPSIFSEDDRKSLNELRRKSKPTNIAADLSNLFRRDPVERLIRESLNKPIGTITPEDRLSVKVLKTRKVRISDLAPFEELKNLKELELWFPDNKIADIAPLAGLTKLEYLNLGGGTNTFTDLSPLAGLTGIRKLYLYTGRKDARIDLSPLGKLTNLADLELGIINTTQVPSNMSALSRLVNLRKLKLMGLLNDLTPLAELKNLEDLNVGTPPVRDLKPLANLTSLRRVALYFAPTSPDLSALAKLVNLESLKIGPRLKAKEGGIKDLAPLANLTKLVHLEIKNGQVTDLAPLSGLKNLKELNLIGNPIPDDQKEMLGKALPNCTIKF